MKTESQTFDSLISSFFTYQRNLQRSKKTIEGYAWVFRKLQAFLDQNKLLVYNKQAAEKFLESVLGPYCYRDLPVAKRVFVSKIETLTEFMETGTILSGPRPQPAKVFEGQVGATINEFIAHRKTVYQLRVASLLQYFAYLHDFFTFLPKRI